MRTSLFRAEGDTGYVYAELLEFSVKKLQRRNDAGSAVESDDERLQNPDRAFDFACLPNEGVGLARLEFIINRMIGVHPRVLLSFDIQNRSCKRNPRDEQKGLDFSVNFTLVV